MFNRRKACRKTSSEFNGLKERYEPSIRIKEQEKIYKDLPAWEIKVLSNE